MREKYHGTDNVVKREGEVLQKWHDLLQLLDKHRANLTTLCTLMGLLREIDTVMNTIKELEVRVVPLLFSIVRNLVGSIVPTQCLDLLSWIY